VAVRHPGDVPEPLQQRLQRAPLHPHDHRACRRRRAQRGASGGRPAIREGRRALTDDPDWRERTIAFLDLDEGRGPVPTADDARIAEILHATRRIAVIGASSRPGRPSYGVFRTLLDYGYDCVPVNPKEGSVHGIAAFATLEEAAAATGPFDLVDVFRRADLVVPHAHEAVAVGARCFWLQLGIVNWEAATIASEAGLEVVMDRCTAIELHRFGGPDGRR
jgi:predicted CoA-binding protein